MTHTLYSLLPLSHPPSPLCNAMIMMQSLTDDPLNALPSFTSFLSTIISKLFTKASTRQIKQNFYGVKTLIHDNDILHSDLLKVHIYSSWLDSCLLRIVKEMAFCRIFLLIGHLSNLFPNEREFNCDKNSFLKIFSPSETGIPSRPSNLTLLIDFHCHYNWDKIRFPASHNLSKIFNQPTQKVFCNATQETILRKYLRFYPLYHGGVFVACNCPSQRVCEVLE